MVAGSKLWEGFEVAKGSDDFTEVADGGVLGFAGVDMDWFSDVVAISADISEITNDTLVLSFVRGCGVGGGEKDVGVTGCGGTW